MANSDEWFYAVQGDRVGPVSIDKLKELAAQGGLLPEDMVWQDGMEDWKPASKVRGLFPASVSRSGPPDLPSGRSHTGTRRAARTDDYDDGYAPRNRDLRAGGSNKMAAGLCAIFLGSFGIHKFILGMQGPGITLLLITVLTCGIGGAITSTIGLIEGIIYLTKSDEEFYELYEVQKKAWF